MKQGTLGSFLKRQRPTTNESDEESNVIPQRPSSNESLDLNNLPRDPADRPKITTYKSNERDEVRRAYMLQGPCQIRVHNFPKKRIGSKDRHFIPKWYETGRGLNQETSLSRAGDTRWGSHFNTITSLMKLFSEVLDVLAYVEEDGETLQNRHQACGILSYFKTYEFVFYLHLMYEVLNRTSILSKQLQRKDLDILEAASMVRGTMDALKILRDTGFDSILPKVSSFCQKHKLDILDMTEFFVGPRNRKTTKTNRFHFEVEIFNTVVDMQVIEFGERFSETSTQLLEYMGALSPCDSFAKFDKTKLLKLSELYKNDFDDSDRIDLEGQLEIFHRSCLKDDRFTSLKGISDLSRLMVETGKHRSYHLVYKLLKLALVLPVATATVERCFSKMKLLKTDLRNKIGDDFMNDALICNVEKEALMKVNIEDVMNRFQKMCVRRGQL